MALRLLLLEDNPLDAEVVQVTLISGGIDCELLKVETRSSFVAALEKYELDLILADYALPGFDGISALEIACNLHPDVPFIFVSASMGEELVIETLKRGATDYVLKQRLERLVPSVQRALREAKERRDRKWTELMLFEQKRLLELIATGKPTEECLTSVCVSVSKLLLGVRACFLLTDDQRLKFPRSITPDFPPSFGQGLKDAPINDLCIGTCGEAVYSGQQITCADIANDERWSQEWRDLCVAHGVLACHSVPVMDVDNLPLGSLMLCLDEARMATDWEYRLAEFGTQIASIVFERDRSSLALRESEERFRTLADNMSQFAWMADASGWIFWYNHRWFEYTGTTLEEMQGWGWQQVHHPEHVERVVEHIRHCFETGEIWEDTFPLRGKDGTYRWFLSRAIPIHDEQGRVLRWFGTNTDITDQKQAEEALRQSQSHLKQLVELNLLGVMFWDVDGSVLDANNAFLNMMGYNREDLQAGRVNWRAMTPPEQLNRSESSLNTMRQQQFSEPLEKEYIRKDGKRVPILLGGVMFKNSQNRGVSFVVDISDRKQAELQLQQQAFELRQLNVALEQTTSKLTERNQELDRFVYTVSHDLKAPLRAITNLSQWIEDDLEGQLTPENQRQMELLRQRVGRLEVMIDGLLAYARIGRTEVVTERINVDELLCEILDSLGPPPTFTISVQPKMPILLARRLLLSQVFSNLISNAIKHHDRLDGRIEIRATQKEGYYEFSVADNGRGIAPEDHERVFGLFQTLKGNEIKESTGIGLSIVKKIIETEGGQIFLESQLGEGAIFRFTWTIQSLEFHE